MVTVAELNKTFAKRGLHIELPLKESLLVKGVNILEKTTHHDRVRVLLKVSFIDEGGQERADLFHCDGPLERGKSPRSPSPRRSSQSCSPSATGQPSPTRARS